MKQSRAIIENIEQSPPAMAAKSSAGLSNDFDVLAGATVSGSKAGTAHPCT